MVLLNVALKGQHVAHSVQAGTGHYHCFCPTAKLLLYMRTEMFYDNLRFLFNIMRMERHELGQFFPRFFVRHGRILFNAFDQPEIGLVGSVTLKHVKNKALLNGLFHRIGVKGFRFATVTLAAKKLKGFSFRGGGESKKTQILLPATRLHYLVQTIFPVDVALFGTLFSACAKNPFQFTGSFTRLA